MKLLDANGSVSGKPLDFNRRARPVQEWVGRSLRAPARGNVLKSERSVGSESPSRLSGARKIHEENFPGSRPSSDTRVEAAELANVDPTFQTPRNLDGPVTWNRFPPGRTRIRAALHVSLQPRRRARPVNRAAGRRRFNPCPYAEEGGSKTGRGRKQTH